MMIIFLEKKLRKNWGKKSKNLLGVFPQVKIGLKKILLQKEFFLEKALFEETPPSRKKWVQSMKNRNSQIFSLEFSNVDI